MAHRPEHRPGSQLSKAAAPLPTAMCLRSEADHVILALPFPMLRQIEGLRRVGGPGAIESLGAMFEWRARTVPFFQPV